MGERETPALVSQAIEAKRKAQERTRVQKKAPQITTLLGRIIEDSVPRADLPEYDRSRYEGLLISLSFPFSEADTTIGVKITNAGYPRADYRISVEGLPEVTATNDAYSGARVSKTGPDGWHPLGLDEQEFNELNELLTAIRSGVTNGSIKPKIANLHPIPRTHTNIGP